MRPSVVEMVGLPSCRFCHGYHRGVCPARPRWFRRWRTCLEISALACMFLVGVLIGGVITYRHSEARVAAWIASCEWIGVRTIACPLTRKETP